jgi:hypothetical protein
MRVQCINQNMQSVVAALESAQIEVHSVWGDEDPGVKPHFLIALEETTKPSFTQLLNLVARYNFLVQRSEEYEGPMIIQPYVQETETFVILQPSGWCDSERIKRFADFLRSNLPS